jgi:2-dehydro-3-deoxyphosphooctonate aldolase (KDO 8-P synthase)
LTERGTMFGINDLVVDFRQTMDMKDIPGVPIIMDCTHSVSPKYSLPIAKCAKALDLDGYFFEVHKDPNSAISDGLRMVKLENFENILKQLT